MSKSKVVKAAEDVLAAIDDINGARLKCECAGCDKPAKYKYVASSVETTISIVVCVEHMVAHEEYRKTDRRFAGSVREELSNEEHGRRLFLLVDQAWAAISHAYHDADEGEISDREAAARVYDACAAFMRAVLPQTPEAA